MILSTRWGSLLWRAACTARSPRMKAMPKHPDEAQGTRSCVSCVSGAMTTRAWGVAFPLLDPGVAFFSQVGDQLVQSALVAPSSAARSAFVGLSGLLIKALASMVGSPCSELRSNYKPLPVPAPINCPVNLLHWTRGFTRKGCGACHRKLWFPYRSLHLKPKEPPRRCSGGPTAANSIFTAAMIPWRKPGFSSEMCLSGNGPCTQC